MAVAKKWYEHSRPIPFDQLQQRIMVERYRTENRLRNNWLKKYNESRMKSGEEKNKCLCMKNDDKGNSLDAFAPDSIYKRMTMDEGICCCQQTDSHRNRQKSGQQNIYYDAVAHGGEKENTEKSICCLTLPTPLLTSTDTSRSQRASNISGLEWPPKCKRTTINENICICEQTDSHGNQQSNMRENVYIDALTHEGQKLNTGKPVCCVALPNHAVLSTDSRRNQDTLKFSEHKSAPKCNRKTKEERFCSCEQTDSRRNQQYNMRENVCINALAHEGQKSNTVKSVCCVALPNPALLSTDSRKNQDALKFFEHKCLPKCNRTTKEEGSFSCKQTDCCKNQQNTTQKNVFVDDQVHEERKTNKSICCAALPNPTLILTDTRGNQQATEFAEYKWPLKCNHVCEKMGSNY